MQEVQDVFMQQKLEEVKENKRKEDEQSNACNVSNYEWFNIAFTAYSESFYYIHVLHVVGVGKYVLTLKPLLFL